MHCLNAGVGGQANGSVVVPSSQTNNSSSSSSSISNSSNSSNNSSAPGSSSCSTGASQSNVVVAGTSSSSVGNGEVGSKNSGSTESVLLGVIRALGVLVCEGRIQGPPRGYKEGPHCFAPLQHNNHQCEKDNYLCDRYLVLVREISDRVQIGSYLCVEVVLCSDCPCGLAKSKCKKRVLSNVPPTTPWQHASEMLLEYWCIGIVQSKNPESMMNSQGLYQAVRSRLHFSQVAAWWSRTQGARPNYIATRLVPSFQGSLSDEHLKRFSETPVEHNFPLANLNDGHYVQVTMWALPRMEDIPSLQCPMHSHQQQEETRTTIVDGCPRAATPSKSNDASPDSVALDETANDHLHQNNTALLDDRLIIDCDQHGKHLCQCPDDEEDVHEIPTSPAAAAAAAALVRPNGERKRRRSLPCRPPEPATTAGAPASGNNSPVLPKLNESSNNTASSNVATSPPAENSASSLEALERSFYTQLSIEDQQDQGCANQEKRYKRSEPAQLQSHQQEQQHQKHKPTQQGSESNTNVPCLIPWLSYSANGHAQASSLPINNNCLTRTNMNLVVNPFHSCQNFEVDGKKGRGRSAEPELTNYGNQQYQQHLQSWNKVNSKAGSIYDDGKDLNRLMSKLSFTQDKEATTYSRKIDQRILDWISRKPNRVRGKDSLAVNDDGLFDVKTTPTTVARMSGGSTTSAQTENDVKDLKLSPKEFDEVIAVLRARVPMGRKRSGLRTAKRRERYTLDPKTLVKDTRKEDGSMCYNASNKADMFMSAILRSSSKESDSDRIGLADISNGTRTTVLPTIKVSKSRPVAETVTMLSVNVDERSESDSKNKIPANSCDDSSFPLALNKRLLKLKQRIFTRDQPRFTQLDLNKERDQRLHGGHESRAKRKIDFTESSSFESDKIKGDIQNNQFCHDQTAGTIQHSAHVNTIINSTNNKVKNNHCSCTSCLSYDYGCSDEKQQSEKSRRKNRQRGKRDLSPISVNNKNYKDEKNENGCVPSELDNSDKTIIPSAKDQERFRRSLGNAASMVFHSRTGLPLTSSPAPLRRGHCCFDFDSSLNSVSSKRSALFELNTPPSPGAVSLEEVDRETENVCDIEEVTRRRSNSRNRPQSYALLGSFEESALNGRLEPVSTVHGFTAEIGASGSFCPKHRKLPVTVFFYTLGDNDKVSSPYLAHINLGKKGYQVPRSGTIQVTLLNPLGTVVKMFVVLYDLTDMPVKSHTFLRQRTLRDKTLRYLIHLRFMSGKSGRIYLHTDVRMIICRKADVDTASDFGSEPPKELRSYIHGPTNPKFSPRC